MAYNLHRSYLAGQGRYTQADPIGLAGGSNRFAYADSSPILNADPIGLQSRGVPLPGGPGANLRWPSLGPSEPSPTYRTNEQSRSRGNLSETTANLPGSVTSPA
ncbi:MAG TPA: RHS repeat-associated core domain-containing protein [Piscinibacter sp.]|nr:RHS repeat-associated core domain-containing protein [Piscinibacter sp.]